MDEIIKKRLIEVARRESLFDNEKYSIFEESGGNVDDAYSLGLEDGEISLARELLNLICVKF